MIIRSRERPGAGVVCTRCEKQESALFPVLMPPSITPTTFSRRVGNVLVRMFPAFNGCLDESFCLISKRNEFKCLYVANTEINSPTNLDPLPSLRSAPGSISPDPPLKMRYFDIKHRPAKKFRRSSTNKHERACAGYHVPRIHLLPRVPDNTA